jgi:hypothetical protein
VGGTTSGVISAKTQTCRIVGVNRSKIKVIACKIKIAYTQEDLKTGQKSKIVENTALLNT